MGRIRPFVLSRACALLAVGASAPAFAERSVETSPTAVVSEGPTSYRYACITLHDLDFGLAAPPVEVWAIGESGAVEATLLPDGSYVLGGLEAKVQVQFLHPLYGKAQLELSLGDSKLCHLTVSLSSEGAALLACAPSSEARTLDQLDGHQSGVPGGGPVAPPGPTTKLGALNTNPLSKTLDALDLPCLPGDGDESDAPIIVGLGIFTGDLADNTGSIDLDSSGLNNTIDEWLCYSAACTGNVTVTTCQPGTQFDTVLSAWTDVEISANDDTLGAPPECTLGGLNRLSTISFESVAGEAYRIRISAFNDSFTGLGAYGTRYQLSIACDTLQGVSDCCTANGGLGCEDHDCETLICSLDAFCCDTEWDELCATSAQALCGVCGAAGGDCCAANDGIGCEDEECMVAVCAVDPFCCTQQWNDTCAEEAADLCDLCFDPCPASGSCFEAHGTPGCSDESCCDTVCAVDFFCCVTTWDDLCVTAAFNLCPEAPGACCAAGLVGACIDTTEDGCEDEGGIFQGPGTACASGICVPPSNDVCEIASPVGDLPATVSGTTVGATTDFDAPSCGATISSPGVWYSVIGTGTDLTASTCNQASFDTKLSVYCGECEFDNIVGANDLVCVVGAEDTPGCGNFTTTVTWCSDVDVEYLILVHAFGGQTGTFDLSVSVGDACAPTGTCVPIGACCFCESTLTESHFCTVTTEYACVDFAGVFLGPDTTCAAKANYAQFVGAAIPDHNAGGVSSTLDVLETFTITDVNVDLTITHVFVGDLCVEVEHNGTTVRLIQRAGASVVGVPCHLGPPFGCVQDNYAGIILDDEGSAGPIESACALNLASPPNYTPFEPLSVFNGLDASGPWTLTVSDNASGDVGTFLSWSLHFEAVGADPCAAECTAACCVSNLGCQQLTEANCVAAGGEFHGVGSSCDDDPCPQPPTGACCLANDECQILSGSGCESDGGVFQGPGTACTPDLCDVPATGPCCFASGACVLVTADVCSGASGAFQGPGTDCASCQGACCLDSGECSVLNISQCVAPDVFQGFGTPCSPNPCVGACCYLSGACDFVTLQQCVDANGFFQGVGTDCTPNPCDVRCCFANGTCQELSVFGCVGAGGTFFAFGSSCTPSNPCPQPTTGACCFPNGACQVVTPDQCVTSGGVSQLLGSNCTPSPCQGACCIQDECEFLNVENCTASGGEYQGFLTSCQTTPCPVPTGACCFSDGSCQVLTAAQCAPAGGTFQSGGCASSQCQGACCLPDGSCQLLNLNDCTASNGEYQGFPSICESADCPQPPTGACCAPSGDCAPFTAAGCAAVNGAFQGPGTKCTPNPCVQPTGACCFASGVCDVLSNVQCGASGGNFVGVGVPCTPNPCDQPTGACCFTGACDELAVEQCVGSNGVFLGVGISCTPNPCPVPQGACCALGGGCDFITAESCAASQGVFQGGIPCSPNPCPQPADGACCLCVDGQTCIDVASEACESLGGTFLVGASCDGGTLGTPSISPCIQVCCVLLEFEQKEDGSPIPNGWDVNDSLWPSLFTLQSGGFNAGPAIFDSTPGGPNQDSDDPDLLVDTGNLLILQNNLHANQSVPGIFNTPDDDSTPGGILRINFEILVQVRSVDLIDIDAGAALVVRLYDDNGKTRTYNVADGYTTEDEGGIRTLDLTVLGIQQGVDGNAVGTQQSGFDEHRVFRLDFNFGGSAALDNLVICPKEGDEEPCIDCD